MKVQYKMCRKCKYSLNPTTEKLCLYCRAKMPDYDSTSSLLFKKGYKPKTFYGKIYKMFTKIYVSPYIKVEYSYGSFRKAAIITVERGHYVSNIFFDKIEQCDGHVTSLSNYGNNVRLIVREIRKV